MHDDNLDIPANLKRVAPPAPGTKPDKPTTNGNTSNAKPPVNAAPKPPAKAKPAAKPAPKSSGREGLVTVASIAKEYKLTPPQARGLLRAAKLKKPAVGWAFPSNSPELKRVRDVLKAK